MQHTVAIIFLFALGACVGSFLNVVVWRLPRIEIPPTAGFWRAMGLAWRGLSFPPSHCPNCGKKLFWHDNLPVIGWFKLGGKCRFCARPISARYPIVEAVTGVMFGFYYVMWFLVGEGPCAEPRRYLSLDLDWPIFILYLTAAAALLAASLIDAELFIIPIQIPYVIAIMGFIVHPIIDTPGMPGNLIVSPLVGAMAAGGGIGLLVSLLLQFLKILPTSFLAGEWLERDRPLIQQEIDDAMARGETPPEMPVFLQGRQLRAEIGKEMLFLIPPMLGAMLATVLFVRVQSVRGLWTNLMASTPPAAFAGALFGALIGAFTVWIIRILATLAFRRIAMGLGDVHLMFGVGAVLGAGPVTVAFFLAPMFGIAFALYRLLSGKGREIPYGPFLSMACGFVMLFYCPIADHLAPGLDGLWLILTGQVPL